MQMYLDFADPVYRKKLRLPLAKLESIARRRRAAPGGGGTVVQNVSIVLENSTRRRSRAKTDGGVLRGRGEANFGGTPLDLAALIAPPSNLRMSGLILPS